MHDIGMQCYWYCQHELLCNVILQAAMDKAFQEEGSWSYKCLDMKDMK